MDGVLAWLDTRTRLQSTRTHLRRRVVRIGDEGWAYSTTLLGGTALVGWRRGQVVALVSTSRLGLGKALDVARQQDRRIVAAPDQHIFDGPGTVAFPTSGGQDHLCVGWFGALGSATQDDAPAISKACAAGAAGGLTIVFHDPPAGFFSIRSHISMGSPTTDSSGVRWRLPSVAHNATAHFKTLCRGASSMAPHSLMLFSQNSLSPRENAVPTTRRGVIVWRLIR